MFGFASLSVSLFEIFLLLDKNKQKRNIEKKKKKKNFSSSA